MQELWDSMKRQKLCILGIPIGEMFHAEDIENNFNKIKEDKFPSVRKPRYKRHTEHQNRQEQNKTSSHQIICKPLNAENKENT